MFEAQLLNKGSVVFSPWMNRRGDNLIVTLDLVDKSSKGQLTVKVFHKNTDDPGDGVNADATTTITGDLVGRLSDEWNGLEEMVRYRFEVTKQGSSDWVLFRMLSPVWFDDAKA
ncbi:MAG: hypothetical protein V3W41_16120 [Planctomycetota bacterium]